MKKAALLLFAALCAATAFGQGVGGNGVPGATTNGNLPTASSAGQVPTSTGPGTTYTAQTPSGALLSQKVVYVSKLTSIPATTAVVPGSSATGTTDSASIINTAISGGNVDLEVDGGYALSTSLVLSSNTTIHCIVPQYGFIMQTASNAPVLINAHTNVPTTTSGTGGYLTSNQTDANITVQGCVLNANSTQAVTGSNAAGTSHTVNPSTGLFVLGTEMSGVINVTLDSNTVYDTGCWAVFFSNASQIHVTNNHIYQPGQVANKYQDGVHFIGPDNFLWVQNNRIMSTDDGIALNADDGNRTGSGDPNASYAQFPGVLGKTGWIQFVHEDNNTMDGATMGGRLLSATELIDQVTISNFHGNVTDYTENISDPYTSLGAGNIGDVTMENVDVQNNGSQGVGYGGQIPITSSFRAIQLKGFKITNPVSSNPVVYMTAGTGGMLSIRDWDIYTQTNTVGSVIDTAGGSIAQLAVSGINWDDISTGTGSIFAGSVVPGTLTCSNYMGPSRLLAAGYVPGIENGDCYTNTYLPAAIHFWPMNEGSGSTFTDHIGTTNLTSSNVTYSVTSGMGATAVAQFNGTSASAHAASVDSTLNFNGTQPMTVAYWVKFTTFPGTIIGDLDVSNSYKGWEASNTGGGSNFEDLLVVGTVSTNQMTAQTTSPITSGVVALIVETYTGSLNLAGVKIYVNGVSQTLSDGAGTLTSGATSTSPVWVGARNNSTAFFSGALAYVRVWNQVLTQAQIATLYGLGPQ